MTSELDDFIQHALAGGADRAELRAVLVEHGWEAGEVDDGLARYGGVAFGLPVPRPRPYLPATDAFQMLLLFTVLLASAWSLGFLVFQIIEHHLPEGAELAPGPWRHAGLRWSMAWLAITWPLFLWFARRHVRATRSDPARKHSKLRKWLTYVALFIAASTLLGDAVALLYNLLAGELTARFVLKVLTLAVIAGAVFLVTLLDLRQADRRGGGRPFPLRGAALGASALVAVAWIQGALISGSPGGARELQRDAARLSDLQRLDSQIQVHEREQGALPVGLEEIESRYGVLPLEDAQGILYGYRALDDRRYELCATFDRPSPEAERAVLDRWSHPAGRHCFQRELAGDD